MKNDFSIYISQDFTHMLYILKENFLNSPLSMIFQVVQKSTHFLIHRLRKICCYYYVVTESFKELQKAYYLPTYLVNFP